MHETKKQRVLLWWNEKEKEFKLYQKVRDHCHYIEKFRGAAHSICNLKYEVPKEIPVVFHNGSTYDYHFVIKQLPEGFNGQFECLGENTEKCITFSVPIKKEHDNGKTNTFKLNFIDSYWFVPSELSDLVDNLSGIFNKEYKSSMETKKNKSKCDFIGFRNNRLNCNWKYKVPKEIPVVFHNGSTYDYHFVIKQLPEGFNGQLECLGENKEKCITFSVPIKKNMIMVKQIHSN